LGKELQREILRGGENLRHPQMVRFQNSGIMHCSNSLVRARDIRRIMEERGNDRR